MPAVRLHPVLETLAVALTVVAGAFLVALGADRMLGPGPVALSAIVALIVAAAFAWRMADGLLAFGVTVLLADTVEHWTTMDLRYIDEIAMPLLVVVGLLAHRSRLVLPRPGVREAALGVMVAAGVVSSLVAGVPATIWIPGLGLLLKGFAFFYLVLSLPLRTEELGRVVGAFFVIGMAIIGIGLLQFVAPDVARGLFGLPPFDQQRGSIQVVNSVFTHPALYGWLAVFLSLFLFARFLVLREWWALVLSLGLGAASLLSGRRAPVVGLLAGVVVAVAHQILAGRARVRALATAVMLIAVIAAVSLPLLGDFYRYTLVEYVEPPELIAEVLSESPDPDIIAPMAPRNALYVGSIAIARDHFPLGTGVGRFGSHMSRESYSPEYASYGLDQVSGLRADEPIAVTDTFWPMILGETGVVGLLGALLFFGIVGWQLGRSSLADLPSHMRAVAIGCFLVFVEALVRSLISPAFVAPPIAYFAFGTAAIAISLGRGDAAAGESVGEADQERVDHSVDGPNPIEG